MNIPCVMDLEASGLGRGSYPIEVGFVTPDEKTFCTLIKPSTSWQHWDTSAEALHHISRDILASHGKDIAFVADWLNTTLAGQTIYSDGWANDMCWLGKLFDEADMIQHFRIESILTLLSDEEREQWSDVHQLVMNSEKLVRHRASSDALMIQKTFRIIKQASEQGVCAQTHIEAKLKA